MAKEYWFCLIGVTERDDLPDGSDYPLRTATQEAYRELTGKEPEVCWSGWGTNEGAVEAILEAWTGGERG